MKFLVFSIYSLIGFPSELEIISPWSTFAQSVPMSNPPTTLLVINHLSMMTMVSAFFHNLLLYSSRKYFNVDFPTLERSGFCAEMVLGWQRKTLAVEVYTNYLNVAAAHMNILAHLLKFAPIRKLQKH